jgi:NADPH:quinone reductase-like Zn-dependent oxidoreductase
MLAARAVRIDRENPLDGLEVGDVEAPSAPEGWATVTVRAAALNHHDLWTLQGVGISEDTLPITLGCDAAGVDEAGNEVIVHSVIGDPDRGGGDETLDPKRSLLSERYQGTFADEVVVPRRNLVPKPAALSWEEAACLPTAWLTAYRMLFTRSGVAPGDTVLVQGAGGGVATALVRLGSSAGLRVWVTSRDEGKRARALEFGADQAFPTGARLPERVDAVMETVGAATWSHSLKALRPGGTVVLSGATSGPNPSTTELNRIFFLQLRVVGSTMGTRDELAALIRFLLLTGVRPVVDTVLPLESAREGFARMAAGDLTGKILFVRP